MDHTGNVKSVNVTDVVKNPIDTLFLSDIMTSSESLGSSSEDGLSF